MQTLVKAPPAQADPPSKGLEEVPRLMLSRSMLRSFSSEQQIVADRDPSQTDGTCSISACCAQYLTCTFTVCTGVGCVSVTYCC